MQKRRLLRGLVVQPKNQIQKSLIMTFLGLTPLILMMLFSSHALVELMDILQTSQKIDLDAAADFYRTIRFNLSAVLSFSAIYCIYCVWVSFRLSHRIYGPLIPIQRQLRKMIDGDYSSEIRLRKNDEFENLAQDLNVLAAVLKTRVAVKD